MIVTNVLTDTTDNTKTLTIGSVDGTKVTAATNATSAPTRSVNGADFNLAVQNVNNVGLTVSPFLLMDASVLEPSGSGLNVTVQQHPTDNTLVKVTIDSQTRTLKAAEVKDAIANALRNS